MVSDDGVARGVLRVSAPPSFAARHLTAPIATLLGRHPELRVSLHLQSRADAPLADDVDVALVLGDARPGGDGSVHPLASDRLVLCASPSYLRVRGVPWTPADLARHHVVARRTAAPLRFRAPSRGEVLATPESSVFGDHAYLAADEESFLREAALAGLGIAAVPVSLVAEAIEDGSLVTVLDADVDGDLALFAITPAGASVPAPVRALLDVLSAEWRVPPWAPLLLREGDPGEVDAAELEAGPATPRGRPRSRRPPKAGPELVVAAREARRLAKVAELFEAVDPEATAGLRARLAVARPPASEAERRQVVGLHDRVIVREGRAGTRELVLVYPWEAASEEGRVSVLAPLGAALFGLPVGAKVAVPSGHGRPRTFTVDAVEPL